MDITLIRTFLEVAATGSFVNASERLLVTQSAVSLRIQRLEEALGKPLFVRSRAGAELTPAGQEFERFAISLVKIWEESRQQIGLPEGYTRSLSIGAQHSLWPRLGFRWIDALQEALPTLNIRAEVGMPDRLMRYLIEGVVHVALVYTPQLRPGVTARRVMDDELVLVGAQRFESVADAARHYVFVDWGPEFVQAHALELPELTNPGLTLALGALAADYVVRRGKAAFLPARYVKRFIDQGRMHLVPDAPRFPFPVWAVWRDDLDADLREVAETTLAMVRDALEREQDSVLDTLADISEAEAPGRLGERDGAP